jgi:peptidoglycan/LPS O-acetylase OafA/YrhL
MEPIPLRPKIYFKNLNAIRFIAAFLVIIHHVEQFKYLLKLPNSWDNEVIASIGPLGVILFFVLSGFLISYLLFKEKEITKTISIKDFYIRRILRIWPLYFLIILLAFVVFPNLQIFALDGFPKSSVLHNLLYKISLFVVFMPNVVLKVFGAIPFASQTWSIGAEEQFYLIWPWLNKRINNKWLLMAGVIVVYLFIRFVLPYLVLSGRNRSLLIEIISSIPIDCMAIGGFFALLIYSDLPSVKSVKKIIFSKITQWVTLLASVLFIGMGFQFFVFTNEVYAVLFGIMIANFAVNQDRIFSMENKLSNYLGKISYGLYMYHPITTVLAIRGLQQLRFNNDYLLYPVVILLTILIASLSYELFENWFIKKKIKYSKMLSGENAVSSS